MGNDRPQETNEEMVERLKRFYSVDTIEEILAAQSRHVDKLIENKRKGLPVFSDGKPNRLREG